MTLTLDVGNTNIVGGVFDDDKLIFQFRQKTHQNSTSDELGIFLRTVLRENDINPANITQIGISSVVPPINYSLTNGVIKYFKIEPLCIQEGVKTGIKLRVPNTKEIGADLIADSIGATELFPNKDLIVVDVGTATTIHIVTKDKEFHGATILPGIKMSVESLANGTSKLPQVEIAKPKKALGNETISAIQSGIFYGHLGAIKEICKEIKKEFYKNSEPLIVATGGLAKLFADSTVFDEIVPELTLLGIKKAIEINIQ